jgi:excisionase family DNA binding protein
MSLVVDQQTYVMDDAARVELMHEFFAAHERGDQAAPVPQYFLAGAGGDQVEIPEEVHKVLLQVIETMRRGLAVSIVPQSKTLTTQQAADLLGVSRPTLLKLLDTKKIPFERPTAHRRIRLVDVLAYQQRRRLEQYEALEKMRESLDDDTPVEEVLEQARKTRHALAAKRRAKSAALPN